MEAMLAMRSEKICVSLTLARFREKTRSEVTIESLEDSELPSVSQKSVKRTKARPKRESSVATAFFSRRVSLTIYSTASNFLRDIIREQSSRLFRSRR